MSIEERRKKEMLNFKQMKKISGTQVAASYMRALGYTLEEAIQTLLVEDETK